MRKHLKRRKSSGKRQGRLISGVVAAIAILAIGATAVFAVRARQANSSRVANSTVQRSHDLPSRDSAIESAARNARAGVQTGQIRPLTQDEAQKLAQGIKELVNQSTEGLESVNHADGSVSLALAGRFQNLAVAKRAVDGSVTQSCVDNPKSAASFFEIDPQLIDGQTSPAIKKAKVTELPK